MTEPQHENRVASRSPRATAQLFVENARQAWYRREVVPYDVKRVCEAAEAMRTALAEAAIALAPVASSSERLSRIYDRCSAALAQYEGPEAK